MVPGETHDHPQVDSKPSHLLPKVRQPETDELTAAALVRNSRFIALRQRR